MKHLNSLVDLSRDDIVGLVNRAISLKKDRQNNVINNSLQSKTLIMLFQKGSTRTRLSFETAMTELGGHAIFVESKNTQFSLASFTDEIQAIMRFGHILMFRAIKSADVQTASSFNKIPVIDACSEKYHPAQALSDILTMAEKADGLENIKKVVWLGIENNVSNTLKVVCAKLGINIVLVSPEADPDSVDVDLNNFCNASSLVTRSLDLEASLKNADFVHTDTWMNMEYFENGKVKPEFASEFERRKSTFAPYQLSAQLINKYCPQAKIMHCMPCHVGFEITRDAIDHPNSVIYDQAENRLHMQKAILQWILE